MYRVAKSANLVLRPVVVMFVPSVKAILALTLSSSTQTVWGRANLGSAGKHHGFAHAGCTHREKAAPVGWGSCQIHGTEPGHAHTPPMLVWTWNTFSEGLFQWLALAAQLYEHSCYDQCCLHHTPWLWQNRSELLWCRFSACTGKLDAAPTLQQDSTNSELQLLTRTTSAPEIWQAR